jgi:hypothetical protein
MTQTEFISYIVAFNGGDFLNAMPDATPVELDLFTALAASLSARPGRSGLARNDPFWLHQGRTALAP